MSHTDPPAFIEDMDPTDYTKPLAALTASGLVGFILGINYVAAAADTRIRPTGSVPAWVNQAELLQFFAMVCLAVVVFGWLYLDYTERGDADE